MGGGGGGGGGVMEVGEREIIYLSLHCHHQNDSCIKMGSDESHFNVSVGSDGQSHRTGMFDNPVREEIKKKKKKNFFLLSIFWNVKFFFWSLLALHYQPHPTTITLPLFFFFFKSKRHACTDKQFILLAKRYVEHALHYGTGEKKIK